MPLARWNHLHDSAPAIEVAGPTAACTQCFHPCVGAIFWPDRNRRNDAAMAEDGASTIFTRRRLTLAGTPDMPRTLMLAATLAAAAGVAAQAGPTSRAPPGASRARCILRVPPWEPEPVFSEQSGMQ